MKVRDVMSKDVQVARPGDTLQDVAARMSTGDFGFMPVADGDTLIGTITDRDIVVRAVAAGWSPVDALVKDCMTEDVAYAFCDEETEEVLERMKVLQIRRLVILDRDKNLAGIVALGDIATEPDAAAEARVGAAMAEISEPSRPLK